jgi:hypothetical protein
MVLSPETRARASRNCWVTVAALLVDMMFSCGFVPEMGF